MVVCRPYQVQDKAIWDQFVDQCKTPLFFFRRDYMGYHADRFIDGSLLFYVDDRLMAIFPACRQGDTLNSHGGLTYGGLLLSVKCRADVLLDLLDHLMDYANRAGYQRIIYKAIPYFLANQAAQEDLYALTRISATLVRRDLSSIIYLQQRMKFSKGKNWLIARAQKNGLMVKETHEWDRFHQLLTNVLHKHHTKPVHSVAELILLKQKFPDEICLKTIQQDDQLLAAALLFKFHNTVHTQYLASSETGKELGALDYLIAVCIQESQDQGFTYFSFGVSTEDNGRVLNHGLIAQKENFGARGVVLDFYEIALND